MGFIPGFAHQAQLFLGGRLDSIAPATRFNLRIERLADFNSHDIPFLTRHWRIIRVIGACRFRRHAALHVLTQAQREAFPIIDEHADPRQRRSLILADIRNERYKEEGGAGNGGDFYAPFWADVKDHAAGRSNLNETTAARMEANPARERLYPLLRDAFLEMWTETMRWRNEPFEFVPESIKAQLLFPQLNATVKIENTASVQIWDGSHRIIYPYFSEEPMLPPEGVRLGFWALSEALPDFPLSDFRIVDFFRRAYFRPSDIELVGNERTLFIRHYRTLLAEWRALQPIGAD